MFAVTKVATRMKGKGKARVYFFIENENVLENLIRRRSRPHKELRKLLPEVIRQAGLPSFVTKASWSQKAGCSCGCSPGFILEGTYGKDLYVDVRVVGEPN